MLQEILKKRVGMWRTAVHGCYRQQKLQGKVRTLLAQPKYGLKLTLTHSFFFTAGSLRGMRWKVAEDIIWQWKAATLDWDLKALVHQRGSQGIWNGRDVVTVDPNPCEKKTENSKFWALIGLLLCWQGWIRRLNIHQIFQISTFQTLGGETAFQLQLAFRISLFSPLPASISSAREPSYASATLDPAPLYWICLRM